MKRPQFIMMIMVIMIIMNIMSVFSTSVAWESVKDHGALGDGSDDTVAVANTVIAAQAKGNAIYFPSGNYRITSFPALKSYNVVYGDGFYLSTLIYEGTGTLITLNNKQGVSFYNLDIWVTGTNVSAVRLSNCFHVSFNSVWIRGQHIGANFPQYINTYGVILQDNTGGTMFTNCEIANFGACIKTSCIQNYVVNSKFDTCYRGVWGTGNNNNAGLSIANSEFDSDTGPNTTLNHIYIDGAANDWWITNSWFEGAATSMLIGDATKGGPYQFGVTNCKIAARNIDIDLQYCRQPQLTNIEFDNDPGYNPVELRINVANVSEGTAIGLISYRDDLSASTFPVNWSVLGKNTVQLAPVTRTLRLRNDGSTADMLTALDQNSNSLGAILSSGAFLADNSQTGIILKSANGNYWRITICNLGLIQIKNLGTVRPNK